MIGLLLLSARGCVRPLPPGRATQIRSQQRRRGGWKLYSFHAPRHGAYFINSIGGIFSACVLSAGSPRAPFFHLSNYSLAGEALGAVPSELSMAERMRCRLTAAPDCWHFSAYSRRPPRTSERTSSVCSPSWGNRCRARTRHPDNL